MDLAMLRRFNAAFQKAIAGEMEAMKRQLGPFEAPLRDGPHLVRGNAESTYVYRFGLAEANVKLVVDGECSLRHDRGEALVTIVSVKPDEITLRCPHPIPAGLPEYSLVIYPWFLYERLRQALDAIEERPEAFGVARALMLFGKGEPRRVPSGAVPLAETLNDSQRAAVRLCAESEVAFVWGPPGTGKTTTLGHIVAALLAQGQRVLVTSTTNAAVDQALAKLATLDELSARFEEGRVVRVGQTQAPTHGAALSEVTARLRASRGASSARIQRCLREGGERLRACERALSKLDAASSPVQGDLFASADAPSLAMVDLTPLFSTIAARRIVGMEPDAQRSRLVRRHMRLGQLITCAEAAKQRLGDVLRAREAEVLRDAHVVLATMTNVYINALLSRERFDVVIVEEAGMAILPTLFYCAALANVRTIMVGDPRQLPPIVQSRERYVVRMMGRSIFDVTVPDPHDSPMVVMLEEQYRMHPCIGDLVGDLYYDGRLRNAACTRDRHVIAAQPPFAGAPVSYTHLTLPTN